MLAADTVTQLALRLRRARGECSPIRQLSREFPDMTVQDAYAIQRKWVHLEQSDGRIIRGYKVGLTTRALQEALRAPGPDYAPLMDDMFFPSSGNVPAARFIAPRVEVELAFVLGRAVHGSKIAVDDVLEATAYVSPAFEIIDARIEQFDREIRAPRMLVDVICDFAAAAGVVLGEARVKPAALDLPRVAAVVYKNDLLQESGQGAAVLGNPVNSVIWLAERAAAEGWRLEAGDTILAGSLTKPLAVHAGDVLRADYGGTLGTLDLELN